MSINNMNPSDEKDLAINNIVNRFNQKKTLLLKVVIILIILMINIFPFKPFRKSHEIEVFEKYQLHENELNFESYFNEVHSEHQLTHTKDQGFLITYFEYIGIYEPIAQIVKYDQHLDMKWKYGGVGGLVLDDYKYFIHKTVELDDGRIVGLGYATKVGEYKSKYLSLIKLDSNGNLIENKVLTDYEIEKDMYFIRNRTFDMVATNDGGLTIFYSHDQTLMIHFTKDGEFAWQKEIPFEMHSYNNNSINVEYDIEGNYYLALNSDMERIYYNNKIMKLSPVGEMVWDKTYDFNINSITLTKYNQLILSGYHKRNVVPNKRSILLFFLTDVDDEVKEIRTVPEKLHGYIFGITAQINLENGKLNWHDEYSINEDMDFYNNQIIEDEQGYIYSYMIEESYAKFDEFIVKYDSTGKRMGSVIITNNYVHEYDGYQRPYIKRIGNELYLISLLEDNYRNIDLNDLNFKEIPLIDYDEISFYQHYLVARVWINRIVVLLIIFWPVFRLLYDKYIIRKTIKNYISWNE